MSLIVHNSERKFSRKSPTSVIPHEAEFYYTCNKHMNKS